MKKIKITGILILFILFPTSLIAQSDSEKNDSTKRVTFAGVPVVNYNNSLGVMVGAMGSMFYKLNEKDTISPSSSTMLFGMYASNNTYMGVLVQKFYFNEDKWRGNLIGGGGDFFFQYYQGLPGSSTGTFNDNGVWIDFDTQGKFILAEIQRQVVNDLYLGFEALFYKCRNYF